MTVFMPQARQISRSDETFPPNPFAKMEHSMVNFKEQHPKWVPPHDTQVFFEHGERAASGVVSPGQVCGRIHFETSKYKPHTVAVLQSLHQSMHASLVQGQGSFGSASDWSQDELPFASSRV
jgi:hypothetical protein